MAPTPGPEPRIPINSTTCPGDATAVHVISQPGSYYLTGNITVADNVHGALRITAPDVSVDLMGYRLTGLVNAPPGILGTDTATNASICNGTVRAFSNGIQLSGDGARIERVATIGAGSIGINIGTGDVRWCRAEGGTSGIAANGGTIIGCSTVGGGITAINGSTVDSCSVQGGSIYAIDSSVMNCSLYGSAIGIELIRGTAIGCAVKGGSIGFRFQHSVVRDCRATTCDTAGFYVASDGSHLEGCFAEACAIGFFMPASGSFVVRNAAHGCTTSYSILAGTQGGIGLLINAIAAVITSTNSYANWIV